MDETTRRKNNRLVTALFLVVFGMVGMAYASVPLYRLFCQVTGFGGTTQRVTAIAEVPVLERSVTVRFNADVDARLPWAFEPAQREVTLRLGEPALVSYRAQNRSARPVVGTAVFNVTPLEVGRYFNKVQCFCFTEQRLAAGAETDMPVYFYVDPVMNDDPAMDRVRTITLSYTFYRDPSDQPSVSAVTDGAGPAPAAGSSSDGRTADG